MIIVDACNNCIYIWNDNAISAVLVLLCVNATTDFLQCDAVQYAQPIIAMASHLSETSWFGLLGYIITHTIRLGSFLSVAPNTVSLVPG